MEHQILEINAAFNAYVYDASAIENDLEKRLRSAESQLGEVEREWQDVERQKREVEERLLDTARRLRKLQKTPMVRVIELVSRSISYSSASILRLGDSVRSAARP